MSVKVDVRQWLGDERFMYGHSTKSRAKCEEAFSSFAELIEACQPFATFNSSLERIRIEVKTEDVKRLRAALTRVKGGAE